MKVLNLYAGIGGNRKNWYGHEITAVELNEDIANIYSDLHPKDKIIVGDAHEYLLNHYNEFDFIWASPPCPTHSTLCSALKGLGFVRYPDMKLYQEIILLKHFFKGKYCVENVISYYDPLIEPIKYCRHYFWTNYNIIQINIKDKTKGFIGSNINEVKEYQKLLGIDISKYKIKTTEKFNVKRQMLRNCVWPELGEYVFNCGINSIRDEKQTTLPGF